MKIDGMPEFLFTVAGALNLISAYIKVIFYYDPAARVGSIRWGSTHSVPKPLIYMNYTIPFCNMYIYRLCKDVHILSMYNRYISLLCL
jgi:hypothetical protein